MCQTSRVCPLERFVALALRNSHGRPCSAPTPRDLFATAGLTDEEFHIQLLKGQALAGGLLLHPLAQRLTAVHKINSEVLQIRRRKVPSLPHSPLLRGVESP